MHKLEMILFSCLCWECAYFIPPPKKLFKEWNSPRFFHTKSTRKKSIMSPIIQWSHSHHHSGFYPSRSVGHFVEKDALHSLSRVHRGFDRKNCNLEISRNCLPWSPGQSVLLCVALLRNAHYIKIWHISKCLPPLTEDIWSLMSMFQWSICVKVFQKCPATIE